MFKNYLFYIKLISFISFLLIFVLNFKTILLLQLIYFKLYFIIINITILLTIIFLIKILYKFVYWFENKLNYNIFSFFIIIGFLIISCILSKYNLFYFLNEFYLLNDYKQFLNGIF